MNSRAQFEEWFKTHWVDKVAPMSMFERHRLHNLAWSSWQASRAAIEVELPAYRDATTHGFSAFNDALDIWETELRKHGISIKGESS